MRLHAAVAFPPHPPSAPTPLQWTLRIQEQHYRRFKHGVSFAPTTHPPTPNPFVPPHNIPHFSLLPCIGMIHIRGSCIEVVVVAVGGGPPPFHLPPHRRAFAYLPTVWLASWRIRLNCFFILCLVLSHLHTAGGNSPADLAQRDAPCSWTEAQRRIQSPIFPFPHRRLPTPRIESGDYIFFSLPPDYICIDIFLSPFLSISAAGACARMLEQFTAGTRRRRATAVTSSGCAARHCGKCSDAKCGERRKKRAQPRRFPLCTELITKLIHYIHNIIFS